MPLTDKLAAWFDSVAQEDERGRRFVPPPWDNLGEEQRRRVAFVARFRPAPARWLIAAGAACVVIGGLGGGATMVALGAGLLATLALSYREARRICGACEVAVTAVPGQVFEGEAFTVQLALHNGAAVVQGPLTLRLLFTGAAQPERYLVIPPLNPYERRKVPMDLTPDIGMGHFRLCGLVVAAQDRLGLFTLCFATEWEAAVEVLPIVQPMAPFELRDASLNRRAGPFRLKSPGGGGAFLGLRPWLAGDSIRHVDWKRSQRHPELLVKEFEASATTSAALFVDQGLLGHCGFQSVSTLEAMRESVLALARALLAQQVSVRLVASSHALAAGVGSVQADAITHVVKELRARSDANFLALLDAHVSSLAPDSVAVLFYCTGNLTTEALWPALLALADRRIEAVLVAFDSRAFERVVRTAAGLDLDPEAGVADVLTAALRHQNGAGDALARVASSAAERSYLIGPGQTLADVYVR